MTTKTKRKVCVVVASRANYGRIKSLLTAVKSHPDLQLQLIVSASALLYRFGNVIEVIERDGFKPDATIYYIVEGENPTTMAKSTGFAIMELATHFSNMKPDVVVTIADRFETLATAVAASYMNIPVAHTQGGEVTGTIDESVRHAVTKMSHIHFPATPHAAERLKRMGEVPGDIYITGCPSLDILKSLDLNLGTLFDRPGGVGTSIDGTKPYLVVLQHPVTTEYGQGLSQVQQTIDAVARLNMQAVVLWPNVDAGSDDISKGWRQFRESGKAKAIHFVRNFPVEDYARLINNCACLIGNSSSAIREGALLGVPSVNIGTRQTGRERAANVIDVDYDSNAIYEAAIKQIKHGRYPSDPLYGDGTAGKQIADILATAKFTIQKRLAY
jgi:UDP-hydrolysing UDP-N-acetyl-D-glucosamine 2-epimerase